MTKGYIHSIETFGSVDGPGVRFIVFMQGCPMRCQYCHNPDSWKMRTGEELTADELLDKALRYRAYWGDKGGITVSGGEALMQMEFVTELFTKAHAMGVTTCLDTSAQPFTRQEPWFGAFGKLMAVTDTVLLDIKHIDDEAHRKLTRFGNANILDCARYLSDIGKPVWIRHVLVPGITDDEASLMRLRDFLCSLSNIERVDVLPYHTLGVFKYEKLGLAYPLHDTPTPTPESVARARSILNGTAN